MNYMGSKNRIAKYLLPIILKNRTPGQYYVEPFVGGANMIDKVEGNRIGADYNEYVVAALELIRDDAEGLPELVTEDDYQQARNMSNKGLKGWIGFSFSFGSKWFGGYARDKAGQKGDPSNVRTKSRRARSSALAQAPKLRGLDLYWLSYEDLDLVLPQNSIIYCDPPYKGTTGYKTGAFDHEQFWTWCRAKACEGHSVFVSEYNGPEWAEVVWSQELRNGLNGKKETEKLFKVPALEDWML